jgi:anti-sigma factor RsiW
VERDTNATEACIRIGEILDSYVSGEESEGDRLEVETHAASCARCARALESRARLRRAVRTAVQGTEGAPVDLRDRIRARVREEAPTAKATPIAAWRSLAAAAAVILVAVGGWAALRYGDDARESAARTETAVDAAFLDVGLKHHVHCIDARPPGAAAPSLEALETKLGPQYAGIVPVVHERIPGDLALVDAHDCRSNGRRFIHIVLRRGDGLVSLLVTDREGAALPREDAIGAIEASGLRVQSTSEGGLGVSGFATPDHLVYVVSGVTSVPASQIAAAVGPAVRDFLTAHSG